jgi:uncharacterized protein (TIGR02266 family)
MTDNNFKADKRDRDDVLIQNKRTHERHGKEIEVNFEVSIDGPHNFFNGFTEDISKGGVFLATSQIYPVGMKMKLFFKIEGKDVNVDAVVRWTRNPESVNSDDLSPGMGLQFIDPPEKFVKIFESFIQKKDPLFVDMD